MFRAARPILMLAVLGLSCGIFTSAATARDPDGYEKKPVHQRQHPDFTPEPKRMGSFIVMPILETQLTYDSNIFLDEQNEVADLLVKIRPSFSVNSDLSRHALSLEVTGERLQYFDETDQNITDATARLGGRLDISRQWAADAALIFARDHEDRGDATTAQSALIPIETQRRTAQGSITFRPNRLSLSLFGSYTDQSYENGVTRSTGARLVEDDRNKDVTTIGLKANFEYSENLTPYIGLQLSEESYDRREYDATTGYTGDIQDRRITSISPGIRFNFKDLLIGRIQAGLGREDRDETTEDDKTTYLIDSEVTWMPTPLTSAVFNVYRSFDTDSDTDAGLVETRAGAHVYHELKRNFILGSGLNVKWRDFSGSPRFDTIYSFNLDATYRLNEHVAVKGGYVLNKRFSDHTPFDYDQSLFLLSVTGRF